MMSLVILILFLMSTLTFGGADSSVALKADEFCVNDVLMYNSSCRIYTEDETVIRDVFEYIRKRKPLIVTHVSLNSQLLDFEKGNLVLPLRWLIATTKLGRKFLMIKLYFESLSLTTLSFNVKHLNIPLLESPDGCLSNKSPEEYETMMRKLYFCGFNTSLAREYENDIENHVFVCSLHRQVHGGTYEENFNYVCCDKTENNILCKPVEDDYIVFVFKYIYRVALLVIIALFCPHVIIVIIDMTIPERIEFAEEYEVSEDQCSPCGKKTLEFEPGVLVSSALDIYSLKGIGIFILSHTIDLLMFATCGKLNRTTIKNIIVLMYKLLILAFFIFGMSVHYSNNLYYLDYRLYVVMICVLSSFVVCLLLWLVSFCFHITSDNHGHKLKFSAMMSHLRNEYKKFNHNKPDEESTVLKTGLFLATRIPIVSIIASLVRHRECKCCFPPDNERKLLIRVFMFISIFCAMFLYISYFQFVFGMLFDVILFTLIGIVVNPGEVSLYVTIPLFILFYAHQCFGAVYKEFKNFFNVVLKHVCQFLDSTHSPENTHLSVGEDKEIVLWNSCYRFSRKNDPVIYFDDTEKPSISKSLFFEACVMRCYGCPGSQWKKFGAATFLFLSWMFAFGFVVVLVLTFGDNYHISDWSQFLGTLAGGFLPLIFRFIITKSKSDVYGDYMYDFSTFERKLKKLLKDHKVKHIKEIKPKVNAYKDESNEKLLKDHKVKHIKEIKPKVNAYKDESNEAIL